MMRKYTIDEGLRLLRSLARRRHRKTAIRDVESIHDSRMAIGNSKGFCASSVSYSPRPSVRKIQRQLRLARLLRCGRAGTPLERLRERFVKMRKPGHDRASRYGYLQSHKRL